MPPDAAPGIRLDSTTVAERYRDSVYRYVLRLVGDASLADDLTQETFLRIHDRLGELRDHGALEAWLYRIATNLSYDHFKKRDHRQPPLPLSGPGEAVESALADDGALRPDQLLEQSEMSDCVLEFLAELPTTYRQVLILHDLQEHTNPEIAEMLGQSLDSVKIRLHRARTRLRGKLREGCQFSRDHRDAFVCERKPS